MSATSNLGALRTIFTPPPQCTRLLAYSGNLDQAWFAQACVTDTSDAYVTNDPVCWPSPAAPGSSSSTLTSGYFSPGLYCPSGYTTACMQADVAPESTSSATTAAISQFSFEYPPGPGETAFGCCPTYYSFACGGGDFQTCIHSAANTIITAYTCANDGSSTEAFAITVPTTTGSSTVLTRSVFAPLIQLVHKEADKTQATVTATVTATPQGLTIGDEAAIGIGVVALLLLVAILALAALLLRDRRRKGQVTEVWTQERAGRGQRPGEAAYVPLSELDNSRGRGAYELPTKAQETRT